MGKKEKYQDNRDIFEKALDDNRPLVHGAGGALIGAALGRVGKAIARGPGWRKKLAQLEKERLRDLDEAIKKDSLSANERYERKLREAERLKARGRGRTAIGGAVGGVTGMYHGYVSRPNVGPLLAKSKRK